MHELSGHHLNGRVCDCSQCCCRVLPKGSVSREAWTLVYKILKHIEIAALFPGLKVFSQKTFYSVLSAFLPVRSGLLWEEPFPEGGEQSAFCHSAFGEPVSVRLCSDFSGVSVKCQG